MEYMQFLHEKPVLYGQIVVNDRSKIGHFKPGWNKYTNAVNYQYYTEKGRKGSGGFSLQRAYHLLNCNQLSTNPENGIKSNYL